MKAYRAHASTLHPNDLVPQSTSFFDALPEDKKVVEQLLESVRPAHLPKRENAIFVFKDEIQARKWASREQRHLYLVELKPDCILHSADWCWLSIIMGAMKKDESRAGKYANSYWAGETTECPVWELLVASATVVAEITIPILERDQLRRKAYGLPDLRD